MPTTMNPEAAPRRASRTAVVLNESRMLVFVVCHVPLAFGLRQSTLLATAYGLLLLAAGVVFVSRDRTPVRGIIVIGYLCGAELLWRGAGAWLFWEYGKYSMLILAILLFLRFRRHLGRLETPGLLYSLCMLPSMLVLPYFDRGEVAFNLSGPVALGALSFVFAGVRLDPLEMRTVLTAILAPIVGLGVLAAASTLQVDDFSEVMIGGKATTAGIGPNQVSALLGLGALLALILMFMVRKRGTRISLGVLGTWLLAQAMMSLSRGGFWGAVASIVVATLLFLPEARTRRLVIAAGVLIVPIFQFVVFPKLDAYTGGLLEARFSDTRATGRDKIARADFEAFKEHPILGVGPGQSKYWHELTFRMSSSHVEYSRLVAEHGVLGLLALALLAGMSVRRATMPRHTFHRAIAVSFALWAGLFMGHSSMRLAAPAVMFALAGIGWTNRHYLASRGRLTLRFAAGAPRIGRPGTVAGGRASVVPRAGLSGWRPQSTFL